MALLFFEKFSRYALGNTGWVDFNSDSDDVSVLNTASPTITAGRGRGGDNCATYGTSIDFNLTNKLTSTTAPASTVFIVGMIARIARVTSPGSGANSFLEFTTASSSTYHARLFLRDDGVITVANAAGTGVATTAQNTLRSKTYHHIEVKFNLLDAGSAEVRVDGVTVATVSGDFRNGTGDATAIVHMVINASVSVSWELDCVYILDGTGSDHNDFLGDVKFEYAAAASNGASGANWTASAGTQASCIDDALAAYNDDTDYISSSTAAQQNFSNHATVSASGISGNPKVVGLLALSRNDGSNTLKELVRRSGTTTTVTPAPSTQAVTYAWKMAAFPLDPGTGAAWTSVADINAAEYGVEAV